MLKRFQQFNKQRFGQLIVIGCFENCFFWAFLAVVYTESEENRILWQVEYALHENGLFDIDMLTWTFV